MPIQRALLSVSDKTGIVDFARALVDRGVQLLSTGGTYRALRQADVAVATVESYTESPEIMDGRVKTLHPRIHGALLAREGIDDADLTRIGGHSIELVAVNLYPFEQTLKQPGVGFDDLIEKIDIGGPSMLRSAAKNHKRVTVVCDTADYTRLIEELDTNAGEISASTRRRLAAKVFAHTSGYDRAISDWLESSG